MKKKMLIWLVVTLAAAVPCAMAQTMPTLKAPAVVTTCGQSPGALMVSMIAKRARVQCVQNDRLTADTLVQGKYNTLIITMGTSLKGMGAAGTDIQAEKTRILALAEKARKLGMTVVGAHIEGMARRVDQSDAISTETVTALSDVLIAKEDSNQDGFFTRAAEQRNVPLITVKEPLALIKIFGEIFK